VKTILIVDDSATMRRMIMASLRDLNNARFLEAANGLEAIERLALGPPDLIVLDLNMPDMHGLEVLKFVRKHPAYGKLPIIVLTTRGDEASRTESTRCGASAYLCKPFDPAVLAQQVNSLLGE
jgi:two-component system chemotaxis response regulator CheY